MSANDGAGPRGRINGILTLPFAATPMVAVVAGRGFIII